MMESREKIKLSQTDFLSWKFEPADIKLVSESFHVETGAQRAPCEEDQRVITMMCWSKIQRTKKQENMERKRMDRNSDSFEREIKGPRKRDSHRYFPRTAPWLLCSSPRVCSCIEHNKLPFPTIVSMCL